MERCKATVRFEHLIVPLALSVSLSLSACGSASSSGSSSAPATSGSASSSGSAVNVAQPDQGCSSGWPHRLLVGAAWLGIYTVCYDGSVSFNVTNMSNDLVLALVPVSGAPRLSSPTEASTRSAKVALQDAVANRLAFAGASLMLQPAQSVSIGATSRIDSVAIVVAGVATVGRALSGVLVDNVQKQANQFLDSLAPGLANCAAALASTATYFVQKGLSWQDAVHDALLVGQVLVACRKFSDELTKDEQAASTEAVHQDFERTVRNDEASRRVADDNVRVTRRVEVPLRI